ncbi:MULTISPECIES: MarR family winged helix-turn-helix transcriptional regulator [unclassified Lentilitoribacter]|jgi:DNA-binding MarR family transcriptional regulator|uniref:MarR family winged helix-turn-helix transcriptional regulator n=1 Tax=unclassified Lentilitoribacter TaxID=2647570 RepID=UPI0013A6F612|nr:MarR family transcriptional regulator [Lentilitoribacter sp. Alg239-R112]
MPKSLPDFDLERYLPYRFAVLAGRLSSELARQYKSKYDISMPEWRVLLNVGYAEDPSVRDIEKRVSLEKSKVSRAVAKLETKGHLIKQIDSSDRRLLKLTLTKQGVELLSELIPIAQSFQSELNVILGDQEETLQLALDRLMDQSE